MICFKTPFVDAHYKWTTAKIIWNVQDCRNWLSWYVDIAYREINKQFNLQITTGKVNAKSKV